MSDSGWTDELVVERNAKLARDIEQSREQIIERGKRFLSEQERLRAAKGFVGALSEIAGLPVSPPADRATAGGASDPIKSRKPRIRGVAPKEDRCYEGRVYHSKNEMLHAVKLDLLLKAGKIQRVEPQSRIPLIVNKQPVCTMIVDFLVVNNDGTKEYHEVKGHPTEVWLLKRKLLKACRPDINYIVVKV